ncbi:hypothetical protein [Pseudoalteromonas piratica]|nr:hypothetical protein [Pseudoalteromonas piratica]
MISIIEHFNMMNMYYEQHAELNQGVETLKEVIEKDLHELYKRALEECE